MNKMNELKVEMLKEQKSKLEAKVFALNHEINKLDVKIAKIQAFEARRNNSDKIVDNFDDEKLDF